MNCVKVLEPLCRNINLTGGLTIEKIAQKYACSSSSGADLSDLVAKATLCRLREIVRELETVTNAKIDDYSSLELKESHFDGIFP